MTESDEEAAMNRRLRAALEHALEATPKTMGLSPALGAFATLIDFDDAFDGIAYEMALTGLRALANAERLLRVKTVR